MALIITCFAGAVPNKFGVVEVMAAIVFDWVLYLMFFSASGPSFISKYGGISTFRIVLTRIQGSACLNPSKQCGK